MSISRLSNSIVSGTNENTLALVNFNIDFSLLKLEAPREFAGLGLSLTRQRRELAEDGPVHRTARRLGALFESITPTSPTLIRAYGSRVSEISQEIAKEDASQRHGVFAECAGVDGTSVWAAATSGKSALSLHLLACMLARSWSGPEATSIWVEIVEERKRSLRKQISDGLYDSSIQLGLAISEDISRSDLAHWDASTRAWLQVADDSQVRRQKQLMLIINNINIPVNQGNAQLTTYSRVIEAWKTSVEALEKLFNGQSQSISKGAVLLGLASWHLYPRLLVLGHKITEVDFKDEAISNSGQLTVGLQSPDSNKDEGVYWSLSLAHLRFYGDPVKVTSFTTRDASRLSIKEFHLLVLGSILSDWGSIRPTDFEDAARFFVALDKSVSTAIKRHHANSIPGNDPVSIEEQYLSWDYGWIRLLGEVCAKFLSLKDSEKTIATSIIALGHRRGNELLSRGHLQSPPPMMGLYHSWIQYVLRYSMIKDSLGGIDMMRYIAEKLGLSHDQCLIMTKTPGKYITAVPHEEVVAQDGSTRVYHVSWHRTSEYDASSCNCDSQGLSCHVERCFCVQNNRICTLTCHAKEKARRQCEELALSSEESTEEKTTGGHHKLGIKTFHYHNEQLAAPWDSAIKIVRKASTSQQTLANKLPSPYHPLNRHPLSRRLCSCFYNGNMKPAFTRIAGIGDYIGLYVRNNSQNDMRAVQRAIRRVPKEQLSSIKEVTEMLESETISPNSLLEYLNSLYQVKQIDLPTFGRDITITTYDVGRYLRSLHAVSLATETYSDLPGSTISLQLIYLPLHEAKWLPYSRTQSLTRQQKFACIAMFESGSYNVEPGDLIDVIAVSSRNSIFVSRLLLEDPSSLEQMESITRVVGNVGRTGMVFMVVPPTPRLRKVELDDYRLVTHAPFDGKRENSFQATSLHLRFTEFEMPFNVGQRGAIDKDLCLVETLVQVFDREKWVADLDILPLFDKFTDLIRRNNVKCTGCSTSRGIPRPLRSIDNWEELLDTGDSLGTLEVGVLRANDNWLARLAAACVSLQKGYRTVINPPWEVCWHCSCRQDWSWEPDIVLNQQTKSHHGFSDNQDSDSDTEVLSDSANSIVAAGDEKEEQLEEDIVRDGVHEADEADGVDDIYEALGVDVDDDAEYASDDTTIPFGHSDEEDMSERVLPQIFIM